MRQGGQLTLRLSGDTCTTCDNISAWHLDASAFFAQGSSGAASEDFPAPSLVFLLISPNRLFSLETQRNLQSVQDRLNMLQRLCSCKCNHDSL